MRIEDALNVMTERARAMEAAPSIVVAGDGFLDPGEDWREVCAMLLQGVPDSEEVLRALEHYVRMRGLPPEALGVCVEMFVLGSLVGQEEPRA